MVLPCTIALLPFYMQPVQQCTWEWSVRQNLTGSGGKVHKTLWGLWIDAQASCTRRCFSFFSTAEVSDYLQTKILLLFCSITTCWVLNDAIHSPSAIFFSPPPLLWVYTLRACFIWLASAGSRWINAIFFPPTVVSSGSFLSADPFKLSIPFLSFSSPVSLSLSFFPQAGGFYFTPLSS